MKIYMSLNEQYERLQYYIDITLFWCSCVLITFLF